MRAHGGNKGPSRTSQLDRLFLLPRGPPPIIREPTNRLLQQTSLSPTEQAEITKIVPATIDSCHLETRTRLLAGAEKVTVELSVSERHPTRRRQQPDREGEHQLPLMAHGVQPVHENLGHMHRLKTCKADRHHMDSCRDQLQEQAEDLATKVKSSIEWSLQTRRSTLDGNRNA